MREFFRWIWGLSLLIPWVILGILFWVFIIKLFIIVINY